MNTEETKIKKENQHNVSDGNQTFGIEEVGWTKYFNASWEFLDEELTDLEFKIVNRMCRMAQMNTNSLQPLNDATTAMELAECFKLDRRRTKKLLKNCLT